MLYRSKAESRTEKSSSAVHDVAETRRAGRSGRKEAPPELGEVVNVEEVEGEPEVAKEERVGSEVKIGRREKSCDA